MPEGSCHRPLPCRASIAPRRVPAIRVLHRIEFTGAPGYPGVRWALTPPFHPYLSCDRRYISVALVLRLPSADVIRYPALWCPDFPHRFPNAVVRLSCISYYITCVVDLTRKHLKNTKQNAEKHARQGVKGEEKKIKKVLTKGLWCGIIYKRSRERGSQSLNDLEHERSECEPKLQKGAETRTFRIDSQGEYLVN